MHRSLMLGRNEMGRPKSLSSRVYTWPQVLDGVNQRHQLHCSFHALLCSGTRQPAETAGGPVWKSHVYRSALVADDVSCGREREEGRKNTCNAQHDTPMVGRRSWQEAWALEPPSHFMMDAWAMCGAIWDVWRWRPPVHQKQAAARNMCAPAPAVTSTYRIPVLCMHVYGRKN